VGFGLALPNFPHGASAERTEAAAEAAEQLGWSSAREVVPVL